jgi:putative membrane protein
MLLTDKLKRRRLYPIKTTKTIMKKTVFLILAVLGTAVFIQSCKKDNNNNYVMANQDFVTQASSSNMFEIAAGNLAINKSTNSNVKAFGSHMTTDHGQAATEMAALASQKGWTIPTAMSVKDQNNYNTLAGLSGTAFDKQFALIMVTSHQETIALFQTAAGNSGVSDADLRSFAAGKLPTLKEHLADAKTLQTQVQ